MNSNYDNVIEAAAEALLSAGYHCWNIEESRQAACAAVEAAAPHLLTSGLQWMCDPYKHSELVKRAERAEAEVERLRTALATPAASILKAEQRAERAEADYQVLADDYRKYVKRAEVELDQAHLDWHKGEQALKRRAERAETELAEDVKILQVLRKRAERAEAELERLRLAWETSSRELADALRAAIDALGSYPDGEIVLAKYEETYYEL